MGHTLSHPRRVEQHNSPDRESEILSISVRYSNGDTLFDPPTLSSSREGSLPLFKPGSKASGSSPISAQISCRVNRPWSRYWARSTWAATQYGADQKGLLRTVHTYAVALTIPRLLRGGPPILGGMTPDISVIGDGGSSSRYTPSTEIHIQP